MDNLTGRVGKILAMERTILVAAAGSRGMSMRLGSVGSVVTEAGSTPGTAWTLAMSSADQGALLAFWMEALAAVGIGLQYARKKT